MYSLELLENSIFRAEDFDDNIALGEGSHYYVLKDGMPYCHVIADTNHMLIEGVFCKDYLVIPSDDIVLFISLIDFTVKEKMKPSYYVSDLLSANDVVYIFDCDGIIAINSDLEILWKNHSLAIDGTKFVGFASDDIMEISCEMDPPGGWVDKRISIRDGALRN